MSGGSELTWQAIASANLLQARKRNGRLGRPKSRTGCITCKRKKTKCDEIRPFCLKCSANGRKCEGYTTPSRSSQQQNTRTALVGVQLSNDLGLKENERRTFDYFLSWAAPRLAGALDTNFWCREVLQIAQAEPVVLDTLLAISTLFEFPQFMRSFRPERDTSADVTVPDFGKVRPPKGTALDSEDIPQWVSPSLDEHHHAALKYYNRAIGHTMVAMKAGRGDPLVLQLSCILFICVEVMRDNVFAALALFTQGTTLLRKVHQSTTKASSMLYGKIKLI